LDFEAYLYPEEIFNPKDGFFKVPNDIGLGFDPDKNVIKDYLIKN
jgi:L-alanine-DL-glutamate epimerase-like enolase superfamily enzyme